MAGCFPGGGDSVGGASAAAAAAAGPAGGTIDKTILSRSLFGGCPPSAAGFPPSAGVYTYGRGGRCII